MYMYKREKDEHTFIINKTWKTDWQLKSSSGYLFMGKGKKLPIQIYDKGPSHFP